MNMSRVLLFSLGMICAFLAPEVQALTASLSGHVTDGSGNPLPFVAVTGLSWNDSFTPVETNTSFQGNYTLTFDLPAMTSASVCVLAHGGGGSEYGYQFYDSVYAFLESQIIELTDGLSVPDIDLQLRIGGAIGGTLGPYSPDLLLRIDLAGQWEEVWLDPTRISLYQSIGEFLPYSYDPFNTSFSLQSLNAGEQYDVAALIQTPESTPFYSVAIRDYNVSVTAPGAGVDLLNPNTRGAIRGYVYQDDPGSIWPQDGVGIAVQQGIHNIAFGMGLAVQGQFLLSNLLPSEEYSLHAACLTGNVHWWGEAHQLHVLPNDTLDVQIHMIELPSGLCPPLVKPPNNSCLITGFPNPFNSKFTFQVHLTTKSEKAQLTLWDTCGRAVHAWDWPELNSGNHQLTWSPQDLPSGVYLYRFSSNRERAFGKCVYLK